MIYKFNKITVDTEKFIVSSNGSDKPVEPQVFNLIVFLIKNSNRIVSREELLNHVWKGRIVSDTSINNNIKSARKVLGDDGHKQQVIKTIHSRGYQFVADLTTVDDTLKKMSGTNKPSTKTTTPLITLLILVLIAVTVYFKQQPKLQKQPTIHSIAVLPFFNNNNDADTDYYGFAIADQVIGALNYLKNITVRPSSSIRAYASIEYNPVEIGKELGVDFILTGHYSINDKNTENTIGNNNEIRLNTELVEIKTNQIVWRGKPILTNYNNTFKLQDMVARQVVEGLKIEFATEKLNSIQQNIPQNPLAYEYYLRSIAYPYNTEGHRLAIAMIKQAISLDDQYAPSYIQLGNRIRRLAQFGLVQTDPLPDTEQYYLKALSLNPELLEAMAHLSMLYTETNRIDEAIKLAQSMHKLNPNNANTHFTLGYIYRYAGLMDEAIMEMEKAVSLDSKNIKFRSLIGSYSAIGQYQKAFDMTKNYTPSPFTYGWQALMSNRLGNSEKALELYDYLIENYPNSLWANVAIIHKSAILGEIETGLKAVDLLVDTKVRDGETIYYTAAYYGLLGDKKRCLELLRKAVDSGYFNHINIATNDYIEAFKSDPEFKLILEEAKRKHMIFRNSIFPES